MNNTTDQDWPGDALRRREFAQHVVATLRKRYEARKASGIGSFILNLDAAWGEGKTYFLTNLASDLRSEGHPVAILNAWEDDRSDDPLTTVVAAIEEALTAFMPARSPAGKAFEAAKSSLGPVALEVSKQLGKHALRLATGLSMDKLIEVANASNVETDRAATDKGSDAVFDAAAKAVVSQQVRAHQNAKAAIHQFKEHLAATLEKLGTRVALPMFVLIDELDRCRPSYAIKMLEDLKHIFEIEGVVFVVATDGEQLGHAIQGVYGVNFESQRYLRRFFDRVVTFPPVAKDRLVLDFAKALGIDFERFHRTENVLVADIFSNWAVTMPLTGRDLHQILEIVATLEASWPYPTKLEPLSILLMATSYFQSPRAFHDQRFPSDVQSSLGFDWRIQSRRRGHTLDVASYVNSISSVRDRPISQSDVDGGAGDFFQEELDIQRKMGMESFFGGKATSQFYADFIRLSGRNIVREAQGSRSGDIE